AGKVSHEGGSRSGRYHSGSDAQMQRALQTTSNDIASGHCQRDGTSRPGTRRRGWLIATAVAIWRTSNNGADLSIRWGHGQANVDVAAGGVRIRAERVGPADHFVRGIGIDRGQDHVKLDRQTVAGTGGQRPDLDVRFHRRGGDVVLLLAG